MIISRTPLRISFINKYCYITCRYLPPFFEHKSRIIYSRMEHVKKLSEIQHPSVRACLKYMKVKDGVEVHHDGDLPARTGMGSSSAFTVGLLNALYALKGIMPTKRQLALNAIHVERDLIKENVGSQDQTLAAFGGFNLIEFGGSNHIQVRPVILKPERVDLFQRHLMLIFTGFSRDVTGPFTGFSRGLAAIGQGAIIGAEGKEGWAWPYRKLIGGISD